jgi:imidazole glycerol-phosphate synthase subunit HisF
MDADGTRSGFDLEMLRAVRQACSIPVVASGGAGVPEHFALGS